MKTYRITNKRNQAFYPVLACFLVILILFLSAIGSGNTSNINVGAFIICLVGMLGFAGIAYPSFLLTRYKVLITLEGIQWVLLNRPRYSLSWEDCERIEYYETEEPLSERFIFFSENKHNIAPNYFSRPAKLCGLPFPSEEGAYVQYSEETDRLITQFANRKSLKTYRKPYISEEIEDDADFLEERENISKPRIVSLGACCIICLLILANSVFQHEKVSMIIIESACVLYFGISFYKSLKNFKERDKE